MTAAQLLIQSDNKTAYRLLQELEAQLTGVILQRLHALDTARHNDSMRPLIEKDILAMLTKYGG